ncbi:MAG: hypothetical protein PHD74_10400 [Candidatus Krumholzibacteria bacterium]|nr:hypothetical protein [Candidatus Krumholzibacteria bacterium]
MRLTSFLISIVAVAAVLTARSAGATGLYDDLPSFFSAGDSARTLLFRQSECDLGPYNASLLTGAFAVRPARRYEVRLDFQFPALQKPTGTAYGMGDMMLRATARIAGDTLDASGLFLRGDLRIPSGSKGLRPFSNASLEGDAGLEVRFTKSGMAIRGAVLRTIGGQSLHEEYFSNDARVTVGASAGMRVPKIVSLKAAAFFVRYDNGDERSMYLLSIGHDVSQQLMLELAGALEAGDGGARVFDSSVSFTLTYRLPYSRPEQKSESSESAADAPAPATDSSQP